MPAAGRRPPAPTTSGRDARPRGSAVQQRSLVHLAMPGRCLVNWLLKLRRYDPRWGRSRARPLRSRWQLTKRR